METVDWQALWAALALMLVIEGLLPFLNPHAFRQTMRVLAQMDERAVRAVGLVSMLIGVVMLFLVR